MDHRNEQSSEVKLQSLMKCPICEFPRCRRRYQMVDRFFRVSEEQFVLYRCSSCGLMFLDEATVVDRIPDFYPDGYWWEKQGDLWGLEGRYRDWVVRNDQLKFLLSVVPEPRSWRLLDVGCGGGTFLRLANQVGFEAFGLEQSPEAVRIARGHLPDRLLEGSETDLISRGEKFDVITLFHVLEHLPNPLGYLKNLRKLLKGPAGLVIQAPNATSVQARMFGPRWYGLDCPRHLYNYTSFSLLHLLGRAGFRIQRVRHYSLRDNAAACVSSLFPGLDPMSQKVRTRRSGSRGPSPGSFLKEALYLSLLVLAQPFALMEAALGRGGTITVYATLDAR